MESGGWAQLIGHKELNGIRAVEVSLVLWGSWDTQVRWGEC